MSNHNSCQYCNSSTHTLARCNADITPYLDAIDDFMEVSSFDLCHQYHQLNRLHKPVLAVICSRLGYSCSFTKLKLIAILIAHYFKSLLIIDPIVIQVASEQLKAEVKEAYGSLQRLNIDNNADMCDFINRMLGLLETYHRRAFGLSYSQQLINDIIASNDLADILPFVPVFQSAIPPPPPPVAAARAESKAHLKKLKIKVKIDKTLEAQECFMCDTTNPFARLGCSHEYCVECVLGMAKVRTKSFIVCAICRGEVEEVQVGNAELKKSFAAQLKKE